MDIFHGAREEGEEEEEKEEELEEEKFLCRPSIDLCIC